MSATRDKVAVVTGAAQGLGLAIANKLLDDNMNVVFVDRNEVQLNELKKSLLESYSADCFMMLHVDVSNVDAIYSAVQKVTDTWGRIDVLVNNAAVRKETALEDITVDEWNSILSINLGGTFFFSQAVLKMMKNQQSGRIINISSFGGQAGPLTSGAHYCASKAGQLVLTKVFARSLSSYGITVNAVAPAAIKTPEMDKMDPGKLEEIKNGIPVKRFGKAEEVAEIVSYLASDHAGYVTGATLDINGGLLMR